jgi:hypothetical protein
MSIKLFDRIKEISYTIGIGNIMLSGPVDGFSSFGSFYDHEDNLFYAITDGINYEIGSGIFQREDYDIHDSINQDQLIRFPLVSTNDNNLVNFDEGIKEVYVTYPATHSVFMSSGINNANLPDVSGLAFWSSSNSLDYDENIIWDKDNHRLGIRQSNPSYPIDVGGEPYESIIRASGFIVAEEGITFPPSNNGELSYPGGTQLTHYEMNRLDQYAYDNSLIGQLTGSDAVIELSGSANQYLLFKKQDSGLVFAGPVSGCTPPCSPGYPSFRPLDISDIPNLDSLYVTDSELLGVSGVLNGRINTVSGMIIQTSGMLIGVSGFLRNDLVVVSGISSQNRTNLTAISGMLIGASGALRTDLVTASGALRSNDVAISGYFQNKTQNIVSSLNSTKFNGQVGINYPPRIDSSLSISQYGVNQDVNFGIVISQANSATINGSYQSRGIQCYSSNFVQDNVFDYGASAGINCIALRNFASALDGGYLETLHGINIIYGNYDIHPQSPITNVAAGLVISCCKTSGNINYAYDLYISSSGHNATNHWAIYQVDSNVNNLLNGNVGIKTSIPTAALDINSNYLRLRSSKTPSTSSSTGDTGSICWDSNYIYVCTSPNTWKRAALSTWATATTTSTTTVAP